MMDFMGWACLAAPVWLILVFVIGIYDRIGKEIGDNGNGKSSPFSRN